MVLKYRYLGKGVTDSNGIAHMTEDAEGQTVTGYTGTGRGLTDIIASTDDSTAISDSSIQSEIYEVLDCKWYDFGTDSTNNIWLNSSTMTVNYGTDCATLTETTSGTTGVLVTDSNHVIQPNDVFEFDFMQVDGSTAYSPIYIRNRTNGASLSNFSLYNIGRPVLNTWIHLKCQIIDTTLYIYVDDNPTPVERPMSNTDTGYRLYLNTPTDITTLKYKNFKVYPV